MLNNPFLAAKSQLQQVVKQGKKADAAGPVGKGDGAAKAGAKPAGAGRATEPNGSGGAESDAEVFYREMYGVKPLAVVERTGERAPIERDVAPRPKLSDEAEVYAELADLVEGQGSWDIADTDEYIEGLAPGLDRRLLVRLRKGDYAVQAHLDLHGLTSEAARVQIEEFLQQSRVAGRRCVLIIHGRGLNSKDQIPVLKERVRVWLTRGRIARSVLCYATAKPTDGGAGAVYVLLRK